jgi:Fe-S cluster biogenesis protein NfuA
LALERINVNRLRRYEMREEVQKAIDLIRPSLQADGGDVELVDVSEDGVVKVRLTGACRGCPMSQMTLKMGIEKIIRQQIPDIKEVVAV